MREDVITGKCGDDADDDEVVEISDRLKATLTVGGVTE